MNSKNQKIVVSGILSNRRGEVLLAKRPVHKKIAPGAYHLPGGHVEFGETPEHALVREFKEEFDLNIIPSKLIRSFSYIIGDTHTIGMTFLVEANNIPENITFDTKETEEIAWVDRGNVNDFLQSLDHDYITLMKFF